MKKGLWIAGYCLYTVLSFFLGFSLGAFFEVVAIVFFIWYGMPILWVVIFIRKRPFNQWLLPFSFLLVPLFFFIWESFGNSSWKYFATFASLLVYALPCAGVSLIIAIILTIRDRRKT